jgi:CRP-like cAMP-binding protein
MTGTEFDIEAIFAGVERVKTFEAGEPILQRGDIGDCAYIIKSGCVRVEQSGMPIETLCAGEIFGEMGLVDGGPRMASAHALSGVEVVPIDAQLFASLIRDDEDFAMTVMRLMARRLRATTEMLDKCAAGMIAAEPKAKRRATA